MNNGEIFCWKMKTLQDTDYTAHPSVPKIKLPEISIPLDLCRALRYLPQHEISKRCRDYLECIKSLSNIECIGYKDYLIAFKICLYLEQYEANVELGKFNLDNYTITNIRSDGHFVINVPSFDNENLVIVPYDIVSLYEITTKQTYRGIVAHVIGNNVTVQVETSVAMKMKSDIKKYNIRFYSGHWPLRCCHYALSLATKFNFLEIMYPQQTNIIKSKCDINWVNINISRNEQQKQAVMKILQMTSRPAPYILFGPPGTGKTMTLVETICQIVKQDTRSNVLVCTPSNVAADEITCRLVKYLPAEIIYRMYAPSRSWESIKADIKKCANFVTGTVIFLPKEILMLKRIIISTLITSVRLAGLRFHDDHFSHIIIDEASQATEPEMLIPFTLTKNADVSNTTGFQPQIVIAGDPYQLGPIVRSKFAQSILGKSMLERLMTNCDLYKKKNGEYDPNYVTKLVKNYRSHEHILHIPNKYFYERELICCENVHTKIALNWHKLPRRNFPIIFQEVLGIEEKTLTKSVYNIAETLVVVEYVKMLINTKFGNYTIREKDIGVVTPFKKQQLNIAQELAARGWQNISVGTVDTFQGQERTVIILSTVRSRVFKHNGIQHIGLLSNPKRFNVSVTRAKALLIIVGNPAIISTDEYWKALYNYCKEHGSCVCFDNCPLSPDMISMLKREYFFSGRSAAVSNKISVSFETHNLEKEYKMETLTNVLVCGIKENLTLTE